MFLCVQPPPVCPPAFEGPRLAGVPLSDSHLPGRIQFWCLPGLDVAFRRKASTFRLITWGQIDPQIYAKAFTGVGKAKARAWCDTCLVSHHTTADCPIFYQGGPAKKARAAVVGPKRDTQHSPSSKDICLNYNRGRCSKDDCPRRHACLLLGCGGPHQASRCPGRRSSPKKP